MSTLRLHKILDTTPDRQEADDIKQLWDERLTALNMDGDRRIYVQPYHIARHRNWWYAVCVGPADD